MSGTDKQDNSRFNIHVSAPAKAAMLVAAAAIGGNSAFSVYSYLSPGCQDLVRHVEECSALVYRLEDKLARANRAADQYLDVLARYEDEPSTSSRKSGAQPVEAWPGAPARIVHPTVEGLR